MPMPPRVRNISFGKVFADAGALWRAERELLLPIAGVFFFVPLLGIVMLLSTSGFPVAANDPEAFQAALGNFYRANLIPVLAANAVTVFGSFAVLNVFLQGGGRTLGEVLLLTLRRFLPFLAMAILLSLAFSLGLSLLLVPGLFIFCRTWLAGPAFAAEPERGLLSALSRGWILSGRWNWLIVLLAGAALLLAALGMITLVSGLLGLLATIGAREAFTVAGYVLTTMVGTAAWLGFEVVRVALYRASVPRQGM